jgi:hypothetical protein
MWILPLSTPQKIGVIFYGLAVGVCTTFGISAGLFIVGLTVSLFAQHTGFPHLGEYQPWLAIAGLEYGFFLGIPVGVVVAWRITRSRLSDQKPSDFLDEQPR